MEDKETIDTLKTSPEIVLDRNGIELDSDLVDVFQNAFNCH